MLKQTVALHHGIFRDLRAVAQGRDGILFAPGDQPRVVIYPRIIANPDVVNLVALQPGVVKNLRPMLNEGPLDKGVAVDLRLMDDPRGADRSPLVNLQDFVAVVGKTLGGDNQAAGRIRASSASRQRPRTCESVTVTLSLIWAWWLTSARSSRALPPIIA